MSTHDERTSPDDGRAKRALIDDPRLTAYALGELDAGERAAVEAELANDPAARAALDELRALATRLENQLELRETPELSATQRAAILESLAPRQPRPRKRLPRVAVPAVAAAATILVGLWVWRSEIMEEKDATPFTYSIFGDVSAPAVRSANGAVRERGQAARRGDGLRALGYVREEITANQIAQAPLPLIFPPLAQDPLVGATKPEVVSPTTAYVVRGGEVPQLSTINLHGFGSSVVPLSEFEGDFGGEVIVWPTAPSEVGPGSLYTWKDTSASTTAPAAETLAPAPARSAVDLAILRTRVELSKRPSASDDYTALKDELWVLETVRERLTQVEPSNTEAYQRIVENPFTRVADEPLSTFSIDVDTASYANVRRFLSDGQLPPPDAVRIEELVNYFDYEYPPSVGPEPFSAHAEVAACPWAPAHQLVKIGLQGRTPENAARAAVAKNLVFLIDVSGSMQSHDKIELLKQGLRLLVPGLGDEDTVAIAVYAGASGLVLPATSDKAAILAALDGLQAGGSTNGAAGIELAYQTAAEHFCPEGTNRVILCTDGDFNVGVTSQGDLQRLIEEKRESGVFLSVLGFGSGNLKDATMETLANHGNGVYYYIDSLREAEKVLVRDLHATLETIAKDVKIQVEFNPAEVAEYRLIGYENRALAARDFNDDTKDAGEIGAGHTVTAFYEVVPQGSARSTAGVPAVDDLKYQPSSAAEPTGVANGELLTVKLRYKQPSSDTSTKLELPVMATARTWTQTSEDFRFAAGVALFGMCLRGSAHANGATLGTALELAQEGAGPDPWGYRAEFLSLVQRAIELR